MLRTSIGHQSHIGVLPRRPCGIALALRHAARLIATWSERARQRRALAALDDHQLRDLGLTRSDAFRESSRPFWRTSQ
jgi:uncharacterized protein YjiS (DUF1127 family)